MIKFEYLPKGLNALARAHLMSNMSGHLGASVIAGYLVGEKNPDLFDAVRKGIEDDLDRVMRGESVFGRRMTKNAPLTDPELFVDFPKEKPDETLIDGIAEALAQNIDKTRESGHNVIFASLAIRALSEHPELATPSVTGGIRKLILRFNQSHPGSGFYGKAKGRIYGDKIKLPEDDSFPVYTDLEGMAHAVLDQFIQFDPNYTRQGYGDLVHVTNHGAAIVDLAQYGYPGLARKALKSHHYHMRLWRDLPNLAGEIGPVKRSGYTPDQPDYWTSGTVPYDRALLTHRVKTMFGFDELANVLGDEAKKKLAYDKIRFLM